MSNNHPCCSSINISAWHFKVSYCACLDHVGGGWRYVEDLLTGCSSKVILSTLTVVPNVPRDDVSSYIITSEVSVYQRDTHLF